VRNGNGVLTLPNKDGGVSKWDGFSCKSAGGMASSLMRRRMALSQRRILGMSCWTDLGHMWRGRVLLTGSGIGLWGNIAVALFIASPSMA